MRRGSPSALNALIMFKRGVVPNITAPTVIMQTNLVVISNADNNPSWRNAIGPRLVIICSPAKKGSVTTITIIKNEGKRSHLNIKCIGNLEMI
jgi:hypothetical protein